MGFARVVNAEVSGEPMVEFGKRCQGTRSDGPLLADRVECFDRRIGEVMRKTHANATPCPEGSVGE